MTIRPVLVSLALFVGALSFAGCSNAAEPTADAPSTTSSKGSSRVISVDTFKGELASAKVVVDVRTAKEFASGHVPGAINIPLHELGSRTGELSAYKDGEVHIICQSGGRSARAAKQLVGEGFSVVDVQGGTGAWRAKGYPTE